MSSDTIIKKLDDLGRIVIPKEFRKEFGINTDFKTSGGEPMEVTPMYDKNGKLIQLIIKPYEYESGLYED